MSGLSAEEKTRLQELMREAARIAGKITTPKKAAACRRNGKLGGRPKKAKPSVARATK
jgi:uncharacterized protein YhbP (UPF0306 family)